MFSLQGSGTVLRSEGCERIGSAVLFLAVPLRIISGALSCLSALGQPRFRALPPLCAGLSASAWVLGGLRIVGSVPLPLCEAGGTRPLCVSRLQARGPDPHVLSRDWRCQQCIDPLSLCDVSKQP